MNPDALLQEITERFQLVLKQNLVGIYVHGSISFGCFHWESSDIDFLAVVRSPLTQDNRINLIRLLAFDLAPKAPPKGIEMSVILQEHCQHFVYPTPYELHYSISHHDACLRDVSAYCARPRGKDYDLAAHFTVCRATGIALTGPDVKEIFAPVPHEAYLDSIRRDVENCTEEVLHNPVYILLNLCRVLAYIEEGSVLSKEQGGLWGLKHLPPAFHALLWSALSSYHTGKPFSGDLAQAKQMAESLLRKIIR